jgi:hypothetical protein
VRPFEPAGDIPRWRIIYGLLKPLKSGAVLEYRDMAEALGIEESARHIMQSAIRRAAREFERVDRQSLEAVPNTGYRVVEPREHMDLGKIHQLKSNRALARGHSVTVNVDLSGLDPEARKAFGVVAQAFAAQMDFNRRMDIRQKNLESALTSIAVKTERTDDEVAELRKRLERLEQTG